MNNIKEYNIVSKDKKVSELFLGTLDVNWEFALINYTATCTEALPLTFLEKMVCGIANLDGKVDLSDLANIMGFNIEDNVQDLKFQDKGETEILVETLRTLKKFGVITTSDSSFSYVELTDIGKEYYAKGRKFKQGETRGFSMYFDITAGEHAKAKRLFSKVIEDGCFELSENEEIPYEDEGFVKKYAESQIPQYYSEKTGNSFTDLSVSSSEFRYKRIVLGVIYDSSTETYHFEVVDDGGINKEYLSEHVNSENSLSRYLESFVKKQLTTTVSKSGSQVDFEEEISKVQSDVEYALFNKKTEKALQLVADYEKFPVYMEKQNLFNFIRLKKKERNLNDVFISLPSLSKDAESEIRSIAEDRNIRIMLCSGDLEDFDTKLGDNVLILKGNETAVLVMEGISYHCKDLVFSFGNINFCISFLCKQEENSAETMEGRRKLYAAKFIPNSLDKYEELLMKEDTDEIIERIDKLKSADDLILFADSYVELTGYKERLFDLRVRRDEQLLELVQKYSCNMLEELDRLRVNTPLEEIVSLADMEKAQIAFSEFKGKLIPEQSKENEKGWGCSGVVLALNDSIGSYEAQLNDREKYLKQELLPKSYIVDTNVFVVFPKIMDYIGKEDRTVLSMKVLDELDKLKVKLGGKAKQNVKQAIKEINYKIRMKSKSFHMESAETRLLPEDYVKTNPDNMILSVALKYKDRNPFIVTNDINFQNRAASLGISFKGLADMLPVEAFRTIDFTTSELHKGTELKQSQNQVRPIDKKTMSKSLFYLIRKAYNTCQEKYDEVLVAELVQEIKNIEPNFKPRNYGFPKFKDLCAAYPSVIELYGNFNNALCIKLLDSDNRNASLDYIQSSKTKEIDALDDEQCALLKELLVKMVSEEEASAPVSDGDIKRAFVKKTGIRIKLMHVRQMRDSLNILSEKQRKNNMNK